MAYSHSGTAQSLQRVGRAALAASRSLRDEPGGRRRGGPRQQLRRRSPLHRRDSPRQPPTVTLLRPHPVGIPLPTPNTISQPFWDGCRLDTLLFQRCENGHIVFNPASRCRICLSDSLTWETSTGRGRVYTWSVIWRPQTPRIPNPLRCVDSRTRRGLPDDRQYHWLRPPGRQHRDASGRRVPSHQRHPIAAVFRPNAAMPTLDVRHVNNLCWQLVRASGVRS